MKSNYYLILLTILSLSIPNQIYSQNRFNIAAGAGFPDWLNLGLNYQNDQTQIGVSVGTWPNQKLLSLLGDLKFHFGKESKLSELKPWYFLIGANYTYEDSRTKIFKFTYLTFRIGRNFYISEEVGFEVNLGFAVEINDNTIIKMEQTGPIGGVDVPFLPCFGISIFYVI